MAASKQFGPNWGALRADDFGELRDRSLFLNLEMQLTKGPRGFVGECRDKNSGYASRMCTIDLPDLGVNEPRTLLGLQANFMGFIKG